MLTGNELVYFAYLFCFRLLFQHWNGVCFHCAVYGKLVENHFMKCTKIIAELPTYIPPYKSNIPIFPIIGYYFSIN